MKKILGFFLVILVAISAFFLFQRHQIVHQLEEIAQGRTYQIDGFKLRIPQSKAKVEGFFNPSISLEPVTIDFSALTDVNDSFPLSGGRLEGHWFGKKETFLIFPQLRDEKNAVEGNNLVFNFGELDRITEIKVEKISFKPVDRDESITIEDVRLTLGDFIGTLPENSAFSLKKIEYWRGQTDYSEEEKFNLGGLQIDWDSQKKGEVRTWKVAFKGEGGVFKEGLKDYKGEVEIRPWSFEVEGKVKEMPREEVVRIFQEVSEEIRKWEQRLDNPFPNPQPQDLLNDLWAAYDQVISYIARFDFNPQTISFQWQGLNVKSLEKSEDAFELTIFPNEGKGVFEYGPAHFAGKGDWKIQKISFHSQNNHVEVDGLSFPYSIEYQISYIDLVKSYFDYYRNLLSPRNFLKSDSLYIYYAAFAQYPDKAFYEVKFDRLDVQTKTMQGNYRDVVVGYKIDQNEMGGYLKGDFDMHFPKNPENDIEKGKADIALRYILPWQKFLATAREFSKTGQVPQNLNKLLVGENIGIVSDWKVDLGSHWFDAKLHLNAVANLEKTFPSISAENQDRASLNKGDERLSWAKSMDVWNQAMNNYLKEGTFDLRVAAGRFTRLVALLEKIQPGVSLGLAAAAPYVVIDAKQDTFSFKAELKEGQVWLNGKPNETINHAIQKMRISSSP